ncbi:MAG: hypothetical protein R3Y27_06920 [Clostridia bacterium]
MLFLFFFFSRKKENAIFLVTFFGQAKKRNAPAAAETALTTSTKRKYKTENYPKQQTQERQKNQPLRKRKIDNTKPKPLHNQRNCKNRKQGGVEPLPYGYKNIFPTTHQTK